MSQQERSSEWPEHGFLPDVLVDHDAPVCELCGEGPEAHNGWSPSIEDAYRELHEAGDRISALEAEVERLRAKAGLADELFMLAADHTYNEHDGGCAVWKLENPIKSGEHAGRYLGVRTVALACNCKPAFEHYADALTPESVTEEASSE